MIDWRLIKNQRTQSLIRDIAQLGRAPALGAGCRRFKSYYPDSSDGSETRRLRQIGQKVLLQFEFFFILLN